jgi:hypothetical protein
VFFPCGYGGELRAHEWTMVSIPCDLPSGTTVEEAFNADEFPGLCDPYGEDCGVLGKYGDDFGWVVWEQKGDFVIAQPTVLMAAGDEVVNGKGYWIITDAEAKDPGQPVYWNVDATTSIQRAVFVTGPVAGLTQPEEVAGYKEIALDDPLNPTIPVNQPTQVLLGNPLSRPFHWPNVGVTLTSDQGTTTSSVDGANASPLQYSITGYLQKPEYDEANPYVAMTTTPGLDTTTEVPVDAGFWIVMNPGSSQVRTNSLWIPFEK